MKQFWTLWISLALLAVTLAVYYPASGFAFVNYDDPDYVTANPHVREGITPATLAWAFTSGDDANWFPLTRISHIIDYQLFGSNAGAHHMVNVVIHALAVLLLFAFLHHATKSLWPSAFVAALFALHPLHVESVAWISERKDVLCALFWFLTLWLYTRYTEQPSAPRYSLTLISFALGLLSKPMIVTLPFVLLLLDYWPLRRPVRILEKLPFFGLATLSSVITFAVQSSTGAVISATVVPLSLRLENAAISYVVYIGQTLWPARLAVFYPYPPGISLWQPALSALVIIGVSALILRFRRPYLFTGWFWFLGTLVPVVGLVQVGSQSHADRYMYIPMTGLAIMLAWAAADLVERRPRMKQPLAIAAAAVLAALFPITWAQANTWTDSETLFRHALQVTSNNPVAEHDLGSYLLEKPGSLPEALEHLEAALRINPNSPGTRSDLGIALARSGRLPEAIVQFQAALQLAPGSQRIRDNLASAQAQASQTPAPDSAEAHFNKGVDLLHANHPADAVPEFEAALRLRPDYAEAQNNLGIALTQIPARLSEARAHFEAAVKLDPNSANAQFNLGVALSQSPGRLPEALVHLETAYRLHPDPELRRDIDLLRAQH